MYGTHIPIEITLLPLLKGLKVGKVTCSLKETHTFGFWRGPQKKADTRTILTRYFNENPRSQSPLSDLEDELDNEFGTFRLNERIPLPKSLNVCVQDCDVEEIKVRHKVSFVIQLHNPSDGHISELRASLPVVIFISPSYLMDSSNQIPASADQPVDCEDIANAPPRYDQHSLDRLYDGLPMRQFDTPIHSGANTPQNLSRNNSSENLAALQPSTTTSSTTSSSGGSPTPVSGSSTSPSSSSSNLPQQQPALHLLPDESSGRWRIQAASFRNHHPLTPPAEDDLVRLCKVPSYATAVKSSTRNLTDPSWSGLPEYEESSSSSSSSSTYQVARSPSPPRRAFLPHRGVLNAGRSW